MDQTNNQVPEFGQCRLCARRLTEQEYHLGSGRCRDCARKCDSEVSFDTQYGNEAEAPVQGEEQASSAKAEK